MPITHLAADENFNNVILRGLLRRVPRLDIVRIQDSEIVGTDDPTMLEWCANQNRILLTHDIRTVSKYAYERVSQDLPMSGVVEVQKSLGIGQAVEELILLLRRVNRRNGRIALYFCHCNDTPLIPPYGNRLIWCYTRCIVVV